MNAHSQQAIDLFKESETIHKTSLNNGATPEHYRAMKTVISKEREAIAETKKVRRIEKILSNRLKKSLANKPTSIK